MTRCPRMNLSTGPLVTHLLSPCFCVVDEVADEPADEGRVVGDRHVAQAGKPPQLRVWHDGEETGGLSGPTRRHGLVLGQTTVEVLADHRGAVAGLLQI